MTHQVVAALADGPSFVIVEGEPGIGKTRLVREALDAVDTRGSSRVRPRREVLMVGCPPVDDPFPLGAVADGIRRLRPNVAALGLSPLVGALRSLFPEWRDQLPEALEGLDDPKETRHRAASAMTELVERLGVGVVVIEDLHWADDATVEWLLTMLASEPGRRSPSVVVTFRPGEVGDASSVVRLVSRPPIGRSRVRVALEPLDVAATKHLVGSMVGAQEVSEEFATFLHAHTDGLPLAMEECVRLLRDRQDIVRRQGRWERRLLDELDVPPTVRDSVLERVGRLGSATQAVLAAASVLAAPADEDLLTRVAGVGEGEGRRAVGEALRSGLLKEVDPGRVAFRHVLDSQAVGEAIAASDRRRLHRRAAEVIQDRDPESIARLARHFRAAGDTEQWCRCAEATADMAMESGDDRTAVTTLLAVLEDVAHPIERRARLACKLAVAARYLHIEGLFDQVIEVLQDLLVDDGSLPCVVRGEVRLNLGRMLWHVDRPSDAFEQFEAAVPDLEDRPDLALRAMANLSFTFHPDWPASRHREWLHRAEGLLADTRLSSDRSAFTRASVSARLLLGDEAGWDAADAIAAAPGSNDHERWAAGTLLNAVWSGLPWGRYDRVGRWLGVVEDLVAGSHEWFAVQARCARAVLDWHAGAWARLRGTVAPLAEGLDVPPPERRYAGQVLGLLDVAHGDHTRAEHHLGRVVAEYNRRQVWEPTHLDAYAGLGRLHMAKGSTDRALSVTGPIVDMIARRGTWLWATEVAPVHVAALVEDGQRDRAVDLVAQFDEGLADLDAPAPAASLLVCHAIVAQARGRLDDAASLYGAAAAAWADLARPYDELLALERRAGCMVATGDASGTALLTEVQRRFRDLGARWDADRVVACLREHGVDVSRGARRGPQGYGDELSPRERQVLALVAEGMTNARVGTTLFISPKTVERHLTRAMRKLDVTNRTAAVRAATDAGLLDPQR